MAKKDKAATKPAKETKKKKSATSDFFDPSSELDATLNSTEKAFGMQSSSLARDDERMSTGLIALDMVIGGGIVGGGWYTVSGGEQSCKSTLAMQISAVCTNEILRRKRKMAALVFDYEGCITADTKVVVNDTGEIKTVSVDKFVEEYSSKVYDKFSPVRSDVSVRVGNEFIPVQSAKVKHAPSITSITLADGKKLRGYKHPILVKNIDGLLEWRLIEDLRLGDHVVTRNCEMQ